MRIQIGARQTMERLEEMLDGAMDGTFEEDHYDETELSRLESRWKQYVASTQRALEETRREREDMKALVSDISHQTKTPLANILLYGELLEEKAADEEERRLARQILGQTKKLEFLIQALVKMSRLESGILEIQPVKQSLKPLLEGVAETFGPGAGAEKEWKTLVALIALEELDNNYFNKFYTEILKAYRHVKQVIFFTK